MSLYRRTVSTAQGDGARYLKESMYDSNWGNFSLEKGQAQSIIFLALTKYSQRDFNGRIILTAIKRTVTTVADQRGNALYLKESLHDSQLGNFQSRVWHSPYLSTYQTQSA